MTEIKKASECSQPLIPGGSNYTAMHLYFCEEQQIICLKLAWGSYFLVSVVALCGIIAFTLSVHLWKLVGNETRGNIIAIMIFLCGSMFIYASFKTLKQLQKRCRGFFDLSLRIFYPEGRGSHMIDGANITMIPFSELASLQVVKKLCRSSALKHRSSSFYSYELNIVLQNGDRYNLLDHGNKICFVQEAEKLADVLSLPLLEQNGKHFDSDAFLNLAANLRNRLFIGIAALLLFAVLFYFTGGYTRQQPDVLWFIFRIFICIVPLLVMFYQLLKAWNIRRLMKQRRADTPHQDCR